MPSSAIDEDLCSPTRIALKTNQKDITQQKKKKKRKGSQLFFHATHCINLIQDNAINFQVIP